MTDAATKSPAEKTVGDWRADFFRAFLEIAARAEDAGPPFGNGGGVERQQGEVRLLIRGIGKGVASTEIADLLAPFGGDPERIALPRDRRTRRRKGIAYVFVPSSHAARAAIEALNNSTLQAKQITLELADERPPKKPRRFSGPPRRF